MIVEGSDANMWFTEEAGNKVGVLSLPKSDGKEAGVKVTKTLSVDRKLLRSLKNSSL
jgi:hypothetical protein